MSDSDREDSDSLSDSEEELQNESRRITSPAEEIVIDVLDDKPVPAAPQPAPMDFEWAGRINEVDLDEEESDISEYFKDSLPPHRTSTIFPAPTDMRLCNCTTYEPSVVTIGFIHFQKSPTLSPRLHQYKSLCVSILLARHMNREKEAELRKKCINMVLHLEPHARGCYSMDDEGVSKQEFAQMLLRDSCFILHILLKKNKGQNSTSDQQKSDHLLKLERLEREIAEETMITWNNWGSSLYDLLKLENQIPFFVLQMLFDLLKTPDDEGINLVELALNFFSDVYPARAETFIPPSSSEVLHLLHLFHSSLIPPKLLEKNNIVVTKGIPSASVLHDAGIKFRPPKRSLDDKRKAESFLDVTFKDGVMVIPCLQVDFRMILVFRNLIAFEQGYPDTTDHITNYAKFMEYLVESGGDFRILNSFGVLWDRLEVSYEVVANLLNKLCDQVNYTPDRNYLARVFTDVANYCDTLYMHESVISKLQGFNPPRLILPSTSSIFRTPKNLRDDNLKAYEPTVVTIGLIHDGTSLRYSEEHKLKCLSYLLKRHGNMEKEEELQKRCIQLALELHTDAFRCYAAEEVSTACDSRAEAAETLLLDGCFILRLLLTQNKSESLEDDMQRNFVVYDLLKLENQIPFFVLQRLFDLLKTPDDEDKNLVKLALELFENVHPTAAKTFVPPPSKEVLHLLHLFHSSLIPLKLLEKKNTEMTKGAKDWIPTADVLQYAGIKFRPPNKQMTESFLDVTFKNGVMEIPPFQIDNRTSSVFHNLIAFEQCYLNTTHITTYARFMDYLVNTPRDVRLLSLDGVLLNRLGAEEDAAELLNKLCDQIYYDHGENYLSEMIADVAKYYDSRWHKWGTTLYSTHFSNPWAIISLIGAVLLLILTVVQTVFAPLSYFHPQK